MKKLLFIALVALVAVSCKKEDRIQKNLWKNGGDWNVKSYNYEYGSTNPSMPSYPTYPEYFNDCGNFKFSKDGTGTLTLKIDGETYVDAFTYSNTEDKLTLVFDGNSAQEYKLEWLKDYLTISYNNDSKDPAGYTFYDNESYTLSKKK